MLRASTLNRISEIDARSWDRLFRSSNPFIRHAFLAALEDSGCVDPESGWQPRHLILWRDEVAVAAIPLYSKSHSYGEFVFDWAWAEAYARHGLDYYPKLVSAIPFTPSTGPRIGLHEDEDANTVTAELIAKIREKCESASCSGWHLLYPDPGLQRTLSGSGLLQRNDIQFHWRNRNYPDFESYLMALRASRRKNIRKERRSVSGAGVKLRRVEGSEITSPEWEGFFHCYQHTYMKRSGHAGYLNQDFFRRLRETMPESLLLVVAERDGMMVASALFLFEAQFLYGRYWGALEQVDYLHFECCFYQGIEFCIERGILTFDPGTQGEHKLLRGFEPVQTASLHWIRDPRFRSAIAASLERERDGLRAYREEAAGLLPYRRDALPGSGVG